MTVMLSTDHVFVFLCVNIFEIMTALMDPEIIALCLIRSMKVLKRTIRTLRKLSRVSLEGSGQRHGRALFCLPQLEPLCERQVQQPENE